MAQRFYNLVLLPRIRDDIAEYKRLNFHLYMALKKALFKPAAWFKGRAPAGSPLGLAWVLLHSRDPPAAAARVLICPQAQGLSPACRTELRAASPARAAPCSPLSCCPPGLREEGLSPRVVPGGEGGRCLTVPIPRDPHPAV